MNVQEVTLYDCGECGTRYISAFDARDCCGACSVCGEVRRGLQCSSRTCRETRRVEQRDRQRAHAHASGTVVGLDTPYDQAVFHPDMDGDSSFFISVDAAQEAIEEGDAPPTPFFWGSTKRKVELDAEHIRESLVEDHDDEMTDRLVDWSWLEDRISEWNAKQDACSFWENTGIVVIAMPLTTPPSGEAT